MTLRRLDVQMSKEYTRRQAGAQVATIYLICVRTGDPNLVRRSPRPPRRDNRPVAAGGRCPSPAWLGRPVLGNAGPTEPPSVPFSPVIRTSRGIRQALAALLLAASPYDQPWPQAGAAGRKTTECTGRERLISEAWQTNSFSPVDDAYPHLGRVWHVLHHYLQDACPLGGTGVTCSARSTTSMCGRTSISSPTSKVSSGRSA